MTTEYPAEVVFVRTASPLEAYDRSTCQRFGIPFVAEAGADSWRLMRSAAGTLGLWAPQALGGMSVLCEHRTGDLARRLRSLRRNQPLGRAFGLHRRTDPLRVVDATAGFGRDSIQLARLGCDVLAIERIPALALWIEEAAGQVDAEIEVCLGDAAAILERLPAPWQQPDAVYLDPMFAAPGSAQVKKDMQVCRLLAGPLSDTASVFAAACRVAKERVVVKRHPHEAPIRPDPSHSISGERIRFDVYLQPT